MVGATPFSIYKHLRAQPDPLRRRRRRRARHHHRAAVPAAGPRGAQGAARPRARDRHRRRGARGRADARRGLDGAGPGLRRRRLRRPQIGPEDVLTLIYTSGTTGPPKGVELVHRNLLTAVEGSRHAASSFPPDGRVISWLPNAHVAERNAHHYLPIVYGLQITCCDDPREILRLPARGAAVVVLRGAAHLGEAQGGPGDDASPGSPTSSASRRRTRWPTRSRRCASSSAGEPVPAELAERVAEADERVLRRPARDARPRPGRGDQRRRRADAASRCSSSSTRSALPLAELWGMSETCGAGTVNPPDKIKIGTVGPGGAAASRSSSTPTARCSSAVRRRDEGLPQPARQDRETIDRRRLAAHRRHRRVRRGRLPEDRRPQEGADHQRGRQEHVAGEHRGDAQDRVAADRPGAP